MKLLALALLILIIAACTPHLIVKPPPGPTIMPFIAPAPTRSLLPTITPDPRTPEAINGK